MNKIIINGRRYVLFWLFSLISSGLIIYKGFDLIYTLEKQRGEDFLFLGILILGLQLLLAVLLASGHYKVKGRLKRISRIGDVSNQDSQKILNKLGDIGQEMNTLLSEQNQISQLRANRISAMNHLSRLLCMGHKDSILYTDINGLILGFSDNISDKLKLDDLELINKEISTLWPQLPLAEIIASLQKQGITWIDPEDSGITCTPVFDKDNGLHFCVWGIQSGFLKKISQDLRKEQSSDSRKNKRTALSVLKKIIMS